MKILFFTGTGNSLWVAKSLSDEILSISKLEHDKIYEIESDVVGIVCPIYAGNVPRLVSQYLSKVKIKASYVFAIFTSGYGMGIAAHTTQKKLELNDVRLDYVANLLMVDNFLPTFAVEDELAKLPQKDVIGNLEKIKKDISERKHTLPNTKLIERLMVNMIGLVMTSYDNDKKFIVSDECIGCKLCEKVCPVKNITVENQPEWHHNCANCFACIHNCPKGAIQLKNQRSNARYRHPEVTITEIIKSNSLI